YPFGSIRLDQKAGTFSVQRKYIGQQYDAENGLSYLNARYYNPAIGRFMSQDSEFWKTSPDWLLDPQNQNAYAYARNNPINLSDPSGNSAIGNAVRNIKNALYNLLSSTTTYQAPAPQVKNQLPKTETPKTATWDPRTNERISQLDPRVQQPAINFINQTESDLGVQLRISTGYRSNEEQNRLYMSSRTNPPGPWRTNAKAGESYHNYGLAIDVVRMKDGQADWTPVTTDIANIAKQQGFAWGGDWSGNKDYPHFEMTFGQHWSELMKTR
ncbi:MAG TPA: RHS repeat-associated core domain-containing protein, partial [Candidatus Paceibacterota bacterium]|nr:RHS repeat-associated core domain-containing protein [Candidatus Paceibacterota bacterium]